MACRNLLIAVLTLAGLTAIASEPSTPPLRDCPATPNCVSTTASDPARRLPALQIVGEPGRAWSVIRARVVALPRTRLVAEGEHYLHAEVRSWLFGFVDDLQVSLDPERGVVGFRSASRSGKWDMGVNRRRVEALSGALVNTGVVSPPAR